MPRMLVHFDIRDNEFREKFRNRLEAHGHIKLTESVYCADVTSPGARGPIELKYTLTQAAWDAPNGTTIFMEHPSNGDIAQVEVLRK